MATSSIDFRVNRRLMMKECDKSLDRRIDPDDHPLIDSSKCEKLLESLEKYSQKLDKLLEKISIIEKTSVRD